MAARLPIDEAARLASLRALDILDTPPERAYDDLAHLASTVCSAPIALVSLVDEHRQWFKARVGVETTETPRGLSFCTHTIAEPEDLLVIEDARLDARFNDHPLVVGEPWLRFYAGAPFEDPDGRRMGTVCVLAYEPRVLGDAQREGLRALARQAQLHCAIRAQEIAARRLTSDRARRSVESRIKAELGNEVLDLLLRGDQVALWELHVASDVWTVSARELAIMGYVGASDPPDLGTLRGNVHPDDWPRFQAAMRSHEEERAAFCECSHRLRHREGHWIRVRMRAVIVERDLLGKPMRIVGTHVDVTETERLEEERRRNAERLELAMSGGDIGLWDWDVESGRVVRNDTWARMFGYRLSETRDDDGLWKATVHPDDIAPARALMDEVLRGERPLFDSEVRMRHKDGRTLWVRDRAKVVERTGDGRALRVIGTTVNVTEQRASRDALEQAGEMLARTNRMARVGGWEFDVASRAVTWSPEVYRMHDVDPADRPDVAAALSFYPAAVRPELDRTLADAVAHGTSFDVEVPLVTARGRELWVRMIGAAERRGDAIVRVYGAIQDISTRREAELLRSESEERLRNIADNVPALIADIGPDGRLRFANEGYRTWLGVDPAAAIGQRLDDVLDADYLAEHRRFLDRAFAGERVTFERTHALPMGRRTIRATYLPHFDGHDAVAGVYGFAYDVTEQKDTERQLEALARVDSLTGLPNRRQFEERVDDALARSRRSGRAMALIYLDVDRFKSINDTLGHAGGDEVLKEIAARLGASVRETDLVSRVSGDEFVVILERIASDEEAEQIAQKIVAAIRPAIDVGGEPFFATISAGVATYGGDDEGVETLLSRADRALYVAKSTGRDRVSRDD